MSDWIWIRRWEDFQHYRVERDNPPAWIKDYTKQLRDQRYLGLTDRQRALLSDIRRIFAVTFPWLPRNTRVIARHRHQQTFRSDLEALNHAGFIEFLSRESLERRLEKFYSKKERKNREEERDIPPTPSDEGVENDSKTTTRILGLNPRAEGTNPRATSKKAKHRDGLERLTHDFWDEYPDKDVLLDELTDRGASMPEALELIAKEERRREAVT